MSDFGASVVVRRSAQEVFEFVKDPRQMPRYLPTLSRAHPLGEGRIEIVGEVDGRGYQADGWFEVDENHLMMRWGSDGDYFYTGHMTVTPMDEGSCKAECHLMFSPSGEEPPVDEHRESRGAAIQQSLDRAMNSIKSICEGLISNFSSDIPAGRRGYVI